MKSLAKEGITTLLIEGGQLLVKSFIEKDLINEIYLYTSNNILDDAKLLNPINIDNESWVVTKEKSFKNDDLIVFRQKELCFQE